MHRSSDFSTSSAALRSRRSEGRMQTRRVGGRLSRRAFVGRLAGVGASAAGLVLLSGCGLGPATPQSKRVPRVGFVTSDPADSPWVMPLWDVLRARGWIEGETL